LVTKWLSLTDRLDSDVSLDLIIRALLTTGATRQELAQAIMDSDDQSDRF
jgi:hypothetical protein